MFLKFVVTVKKAVLIQSCSSLKLFFDDLFSKNCCDFNKTRISGWVHSNEKPYLFGLYPSGEFDFTEDDKKFREIFINALAEFTKNG